MNGLSSIKKIVISAMCVTLCVVLPMAFHTIPNAGSVISPMHIPALLCGLICGWPYGLVCGLMGPLLSNFVTGMPLMVYLPSMMIELAVYGVVTGLLMRFIHTKNIYADLYVSLLTAMIAGRILAGLSRGFIFTSGGYTLALWASSYFVSTLPGVVIQLVLIPAIILTLEKTRLIPARYPNK